MKKESFENSFDRLEKLVAQLEAGELSLEDSLKAFETGMKLVQQCEAKLQEAQKKIELLVREPSGKERVVAFEEEAE